MRIVVTIRYICKPGTREKMMAEINAAGVEEHFSDYPENLAYKFAYAVNDPDAIDLCDMWADEPGFRRHMADPMCKVTAEIRSRYVVDRQAFITAGEAFQP